MGAPVITGKDLISWGMKPGPHFADAIRSANEAAAAGGDPRAAAMVLVPPPVLALQDPAVLHESIRPETPEDDVNIANVRRDMAALMRVPTVRAGAIMPDACPAGTIPVGGVVETENAIHPGFHSADICCSVAISVIGAADPKTTLDVGFASTHFGYGGRRDPLPVPAAILERAEANKFLRPHMQLIRRDFASQGDGNHFFYVGRLASNGETAIVTHHGSRGPGAALYKSGIRCADGYRVKLSPATPKGAAWIPADTEDGRDYWDALQIIRDWTEASHLAIHDLTISRVGADLRDRFWNEHNFIFKRGDRFFHAKGATPGWASYERTLVPLSMADPVLITAGADASNGLGFLPHGAGRNLSRTQYLRTASDLSAPAGIDARFFSGTPDPSEYPGAYKPAASITAQMGEFGLAAVVDRVEPYGSIMAGELEKFWLKKAPAAHEAETAGGEGGRDG